MELIVAAVFVLNRDGNPLMPTTRCGHVRLLLKQKKAVVVQVKPFTIRLLYETPNVVQPLVLGIDPGRTNIGLSVVTETGASVFQAECVTRNKEVPKLMKDRKAHRQQSRHFRRRCKRQRRAKHANTVYKAGMLERVLPGAKEPIVCHDIRNKEARFNNRVRPVGWLTPTATQLLCTHLNLVDKLKAFLPITDVTLEANKFAFMRMDDPTAKGIDFCNGQLKGLDGVKDYVWQYQKGVCLFCKQPIEHYHHIVPRKGNGSETLINRVGLCTKHHDLIHKDLVWQEKLYKKAAGGAKKYHALSVLNQIIPALTNGLKERFPEHVHLTEGSITAALRELYGFEKTHAMDAFCIARASLDCEPNMAQDTPTFQIKQFRRHDRQATHKENLNRVYVEDGVPVAVNRHKSADQKEDSLEEFRQRNPEAVISTLTVKPHLRQYKDMHRLMPGSIFVVEGSAKQHVLQGAKGRHNGTPDYYVDTRSNQYRARKCSQVYLNTGLVFL